MAQFEATYSQIIIQNPVVSKGQPSFFWWWKQLSSVWKEQFSTPLQIAQARPDRTWLSGLTWTEPRYPGNSTVFSSSWEQVNEDALVTTGCQQQFISLVGKWTATDLPIFFSSERLMLQKWLKALKKS